MPPMRSHPRSAPHPRHAASFLVALALIVACGTLAAGCSRRGSERSRVPAGADTLANGLPRVLVPKLDAWVGLWAEVTPGFAADSLFCVARGSFQFQSAQQAAGAKFVEDVRVRANIIALSPDSVRALDFDRYLDFDVDPDGNIRILREPDSAPVLTDLVADTLWIVEFCGTSCFYDGAYWLESSRFALTGCVEASDQPEGPWRAFLDIYDLNSHQVSRWWAHEVNRADLERYVSASEAALAARLRTAGLRSDSAVSAN